MHEPRDRHVRVVGRGGLAGGRELSEHRELVRDQLERTQRARAALLEAFDCDVLAGAASDRATDLRPRSAAPGACALELKVKRGHEPGRPLSPARERRLQQTTSRSFSRGIEVGPAPAPVAEQVAVSFVSEDDAEAGFHLTLDFFGNYILMQY